MSDSGDQLNNGVISQWAHQLGLASSALFGRQDSQTDGAHFALLDGRRASFACSIVESADITASESRDWQWSADLAHHVLLTSNEVRIRSGDSTSRRFDRASVERQLEEFHAFLDYSGPFSLPDIVPFLVDEFLQLWSIMPGDHSKGPDALAVFLLALQAAGETDESVFEDARWRQKQGSILGLEGLSLELLDHLTPAIMHRAAGLRARTPLGLKIVPGLVLRHAAGRLFQEAHAYLEAAQFGLWGDSQVKTVPTFSPTGAYFTPVPIARLVAESALGIWSDLPPKFSIADFACGSAVFLCEALRVLERRGYRGTVRLIGRDISPEAVTMAKVAIAATKSDLANVTVEIDIEQSNMLESAWPSSDVVLMNPPFRSWERMKDHERDWVKTTIGRTHHGRPDLSVGFVEHALRVLYPGGVLATLLPAGVLASEGLSKWRETLAERSTPTLIAVLGEHGLFRHAFVNVGILVLNKALGTSGEDARLLSVAWASPEIGASSDAIRALRRVQHLPGALVTKASTQASWTVTQTSLRAWKQRASWLPGPGVLGPLLDSLQSTVQTRVEDLFSVRQGIRTGAKAVFVIARNAVDTLPKSERLYFRPAVEAASFVEGEIQPSTYLFVPDPSWQSEDQVCKAVPEFFRSHLEPAKDILRARKGIDPNRWWELTRARGWAFEGSPRLVSKRFGLYPAFARDMEGTLAIVQANAWAPTKRLSGSRAPDALGILTAYWWLLNSRVMVALFREYCPNVAGGQLDLEHKYVRHVPLPDLTHCLHEDPGLQQQAMLMRTSFPMELPPIVDRDHFAAAAFGTSIADWPIAH